MADATYAVAALVSLHVAVMRETSGYRGKPRGRSSADWQHWSCDRAGGDSVSNYLSAFLAPRLLVGAVLVLLVAAGLTWVLRRWLDGPRARLAWFLFVVSLGVVVLTTLLRESPTGPCVACLGEWRLAKVLAGAAGTDVLLNVALFMLPAFLATLLWRAPLLVTGAGLLVSLVIEIAQPLLGVGANDAMDLIANTAGAAIGAGAAAVVLVISDGLRDRRLDARRTVRLGLSLAVCTAVLVGGPAWMATARQSAVANQLQRDFAGTTLADYRSRRDVSWDAKLIQLATDIGNPTVVVRRDDTIARERYSWSFYLAVRCVIAEWTPSGFTAIRLDGTACTQTLELRP